MNKIEKHIFDTLSSGRGVNLPGIGSLFVERQAAEYLSGGKMNPPQQKVSFSLLENTAFASVADMEGYTEWAHSVFQENALEIKGVGVLREGKFYPSVELHDRLNPVSAEPVKVRRKSMFWSVFLISLGALAVIAVIIVLILGRRYTPTEESIKAAKAAKGIENVHIADVEQVENARQAEESYQAEEKTEQEEGAALRNDVPVYHLVVGVFSESVNADKIIAADQLGIGVENYKKMPFKGGKTMVSAYSSNDRNDVESRRKQLSSKNSELWIHTEKP